MSVVGDPSVFAIEWQETRRDNLQHRVLGHFCFWVRGERIGDFDEIISLSSPVDGLRDVVSHAHERRIESLEGRPKEEIFAYIREGQVPPELRQGWEYDSFLRQVFYLDHVGGDAFAYHWDVILLDDGAAGAQRLIWRDNRGWPIERLSKALLPDRTFDIVAEQFIATHAPMLPVTLWGMFHWSGKEPIEFNGMVVHHQYRRQVRGWTEVRVRRLRHNWEIPQVVRVKSGRVDLEFEGQRTRDLILWADSTPEECTFSVLGQQGAMLKIWNQWREPGVVGPCGSGGNSGMLVEQTCNGLRLSCSDGLGPLDFGDLVIELGFRRIAPQ